MGSHLEDAPVNKDPYTLDHSGVGRSQSQSMPLPFEAGHGKATRKLIKGEVAAKQTIQVIAKSAAAVAGVSSTYKLRD